MVTCPKRDGTCETWLPLLSSQGTLWVNVYYLFHLKHQIRLKPLSWLKIATLASQKDEIPDKIGEDLKFTVLFLNLIEHQMQHLVTTFEGRCITGQSANIYSACWLVGLLVTYHLQSVCKIYFRAPVVCRVNSVWVQCSDPTPAPLHFCWPSAAGGQKTKCKSLRRETSRTE